MKTVGFVILHYGETEITQQCIESILQLETDSRMCIVIVDNDYNKDQQARAIQKQTWEKYQNLAVVTITENIGFSRANNIGYAYMKEYYRPDYVVVANNDIIFEQADFIDRMERSAQLTQCDVIGPDIFSLRTKVHQSPIDVSMRTIQQVNYTIWMNRICLKLFPVCYPLLKKSMAYDAVRTDAVDWDKKQFGVVLCGACVIFTKRYIDNEEKIFSPETRFYYEEYILQYQCQKKGYQIGYIPDIQVMHSDGVATVTKNVNEKKRLRFIMQNTMESAMVYRRLLDVDEIE